MLRLGSPVLGEGCAHRELKCRAWGKPWCTNSARLAQAEQGSFAWCPGAAGLPSCPRAQWLQAAAANCLRGWFKPWAITAKASLWALCPSGAHCWPSRPWLAVSSFQQQPVASRQVGIKPLSLVCLYRPLKENSNRNWFHILDLNIRAYPQRIQCTC